MNETQLREVLAAMLADPKTSIKGAYRVAIEMWLAQNAAQSAIREAA